MPISARPMRSTPRTWLDWHVSIRSCLYPLKHRGEDSQAHMAMIRSRQALVGCRTQLVNHVLRSGQVLRGPLAQVPCEELPQASLRAHPRGTPPGPRAHLGDDRLADGAHPQLRAPAGGDL